jgi:translocator protein
MSMNKKLLSIAQTILFAVMIAVNAMANIVPINGYNTGEISSMFPNLFVPAGFTFSIWSVIYLLLLSYVIVSGYILWKGDEKHLLMPYVKSIAITFLITCVLNCAWILSWHYLQVVLSLIIMLWFLRTLILIYQKMQLHRTLITGFQLWTLYTPFVVYLAWICVATIANSTALLVHIQWNSFGLPEWMWSCIMIVIAFLLTAGFAYWRGELAFGLVTAWALYGIYKGQLASNETVAYTALSASILSLLIAVLGFIKWNRKTPLEGII